MSKNIVRKLDNKIYTHKHINNIEAIANVAGKLV